MQHDFDDDGLIERNFEPHRRPAAATPAKLTPGAKRLTLLAAAAGIALAVAAVLGLRLTADPIELAVPITFDPPLADGVEIRISATGDARRGQPVGLVSTEAGRPAHLRVALRHDPLAALLPRPTSGDDFAWIVFSFRRDRREPWAVFPRALPTRERLTELATGRERLTIVTPPPFAEPTPRA